MQEDRLFHARCCPVSRRPAARPHRAKTGQYPLSHIATGVQMEKLFRILVITSLFILLVAITQANQATVDLDQMKRILDEKNVSYFVVKSPTEKNGFIGINYLKDVSLIVIHANVLDDNVSFVDDSIAAKEYKKAYLDLSLMKGNSYTIIFDFMIDGLEKGSSSGDFVKNNDQVVYLNKDADEVGMDSGEALDNFVREHSRKYMEWLLAIRNAL
jgi:hypothetical protein